VGEFSLFGSDRRYLLIRLCGLCIFERKSQRKGRKSESDVLDMGRYPSERDMLKCQFLIASFGL
jgi:hypothetical protein